MRPEKKQCFTISTIFVVLIISGCAPMYVPNVVNSPLLSNKGEVQTAIYGGTSGFDPQLAYAVTDNIGIMLNGSFQDQTSDTTDNFHKHQFVELGAGYYKKISEIYRIEVFGGFGLGELQAYDESSIFVSHSDVTSNRIFIQPAIGLTTKYADLGFASRFVVLNAKQGSIKSSRPFIEPTLSVRAGSKYVKAVFQLGYSVPLYYDNIYNINYQPLLFSIGLHGCFNKTFE
ncbi:MAG: hypothetical protein K8R35_08870 [Bacteroidales bacterium]|nr:hypothetical protein [Bacteroidales bacterium]